MYKHKLIKRIHLAGLGWLTLCLIYIMALALRSAGVRWWVIFSLSSYSALLISLLVSLYLFAVYRGFARTQRIVVEHPLTTSEYYMFFYVSAPLLGTLTGCFGGISTTIVSEFLSEVSVASLGAAFLVWVIIDPVAGFIEVLTPTSLKHRSERIAQARADKEKKQKDRERLLAEVIHNEEFNLHNQQELLNPLAERLAELLSTDSKNFEQAEEEAVEMGVKAWQMGGLNCMRQLREKAIAIYRKRHTDSPINDYFSVWWDGIGNWRNPSLG
jgi:hypothetical protein